MNYQLRPLTLNPDQLSGLSSRLITSHHENNYAGAVKRLNAVRSELAALDWSAAATFTINGLKREELIAANSAVLHELYFDNLGGDGVLSSCGLSVALTRDFGSVDAWRSQFMGLANAMAMLDLRSGRRVWEREVGGTQTPAVAGDWVFLLTRAGSLICMTRDEGLVRWITPLPAFAKLPEPDITPL